MADGRCHVRALAFRALLALLRPLPACSDPSPWRGPPRSDYALVPQQALARFLSVRWPYKKRSDCPHRTRAPSCPCCPLRSAGRVFFLFVCFCFFCLMVSKPHTRAPPTCGGAFPAFLVPGYKLPSSPQRPGLSLFLRGVQAGPLPMPGRYSARTRFADL